MEKKDLLLKKHIPQHHTHSKYKENVLCQKAEWLKYLKIQEAIDDFESELFLITVNKVIHINLRDSEPLWCCTCIIYFVYNKSLLIIIIIIICSSDIKHFRLHAGCIWDFSYLGFFVWSRCGTHVGDSELGSSVEYCQQLLTSCNEPRQPPRSHWRTCQQGISLSHSLLLCALFHFTVYFIH